MKKIILSTTMMIMVVLGLNVNAEEELTEIYTAGSNTFLFNDELETSKAEDPDNFDEAEISFEDENIHMDVDDWQVLHDWDYFDLYINNTLIITRGEPVENAGIDFDDPVYKITYTDEEDTAELHFTFHNFGGGGVTIRYEDAVEGTPIHGQLDIEFRTVGTPMSTEQDGYKIFDLDYIEKIYYLFDENLLLFVNDELAVKNGEAVEPYDIWYTNDKSFNMDRDGLGHVEVIIESNNVYLDFQDPFNGQTFDFAFYREVLDYETPQMENFVQFQNLIENGDFTDTTHNWTSTTSDASIEDNKLIVSHIDFNSNHTVLNSNVEINEDDMYYYQINAKFNEWLTQASIMNGENDVLLQPFEAYGEFSYYYGTFVSEKDQDFRIFLEDSNGATPSEIDEIMLFNVTSLYEQGYIENETKEAFLEGGVIGETSAALNHFHYNDQDFEATFKSWASMENTTFTLERKDEQGESVGTINSVVFDLVYDSEEKAYVYEATPYNFSSTADYPYYFYTNGNLTEKRYTTSPPYEDFGLVLDWEVAIGDAAYKPLSQNFRHDETDATANVYTTNEKPYIHYQFEEATEDYSIRIFVEGTNEVFTINSLDLYEMAGEAGFVPLSLNGELAPYIDDKFHETSWGDNPLNHDFDFENSLNSYHIHEWTQDEVLQLGASIFAVQNQDALFSIELTREKVTSYRQMGVNITATQPMRNVYMSMLLYDSVTQYNHGVNYDNDKQTNRIRWQTPELQAEITGHVEMVWEKGDTWTNEANEEDYAYIFEETYQAAPATAIDERIDNWLELFGIDTGIAGVLIATLFIAAIIIVLAISKTPNLVLFLTAIILMMTFVALGIYPIWLPMIFGMGLFAIILLLYKGGGTNV